MKRRNKNEKKEIIGKEENKNEKGENIIEKEENKNEKK